MKQQILDALKTRFSGVAEHILNRIADRLAKTVTTEDQVATSVEGVSFQSVLDSYGDNRATEATQSAVTNYEKKHGLKEGQKATGGEPPITEPDPNGKPDDTPAWAKTLIDSNKVLSDKVTAMEGAKVTDTRRQKFDAIIANLPDNQKTAYKRTSIDSLSDEEFETLITDVTAEVGVIEADAKAQGSVFHRPIGGGGGNGKTEPTAAELGDVASQLNLGQS